jgi:hypothetical protein
VANLKSNSGIDIPRRPSLSSRRVMIPSKSKRNISEMLSLYHEWFNMVSGILALARQIHE